MRIVRLARLALGEAGASPWRAWPLAAGLALGVAFLIFFLGLASRLEGMLKERVLGTLPDRIRVQPSAMALGPLELQEGLSRAITDKVRATPGVRDVFRQAHFPGPCQLYGSYGGQHLVTDLVLEGVDPGQVTPDLAPGQRFEAVPDGEEVPAVVPRAMLDILNAGISVNTSLPNLSSDALVGKHFTLRVGTSSFNPGPYREVRCVIVGVSDQIGFGGPAVPFSNLERWSDGPVAVHSLTVQLEDPSRMADVVPRLHELGLETPGIEAAERISQAAVWGRSGIFLFSLAILLVAGVGISSGLSLQIKEESRFIGLYRAVGATRRDILLLYLTRAGGLGLAGSLLGLVGGWIGGLISNVLAGYYLPAGLAEGGIFMIDPGSTALAVLFGLGASLASGLVPARRAAAMRPVDCLRGD
ncbi:MAG: FtsX-like permease family protein [Armatimonadetes bacterium]|nr:FtsX-like permease family protein [Armatimonadota bacterium]